MRPLFLLIMFFVVCGVISCESKLSSPTPRFVELDSLLESHPDSVLLLIQDINTEDLSNSEQAEYALLMVKAMDKNYIPFHNDSLIMVAVDYYKNRSQRKEQQANSYYYLGRVYEGLGDDVAATEAYLYVLDILGEKEVSKLHLFANINLASCYFYQDLYARSMERYKNAYDIATQLGDTSNSFFPLRALGNIYASTSRPDSALIYYQQSLDVAERVGDSLYRSIVLSDIAQLYNIRKRYDEANKYISRAIHISPGRVQCYYIKGDILSNLNQFDSARYYLEKSMDMSSDLYAYVASNYELYNLEKNTGNYENAIKYADNYILYYDSIQHQTQSAEISKLMNDHALESHKKEVDARQQRFMLYYVIGILAFLGICVFVFFHIDRNKKQKLINLQQELMQNRSQLIRLQHKLTTSTTEIEKERQEARQQLQKRQDELYTRMFETSSSYKIIQEFVSAKRQKRRPKVWAEKDRLQMQQTISEIYVDFIQQQQQLFPQLSQGDIYYCVLMYMGFSKSLIGYIMGVDINVVNQRRYRIKGKMDESDFDHIFSSFPAST